MEHKQRMLPNTCGNKLVLGLFKLQAKLANRKFDCSISQLLPVVNGTFIFPLRIAVEQFKRFSKFSKTCLSLNQNILTIYIIIQTLADYLTYVANGEDITYLNLLFEPAREYDWKTMERYHWRQKLLSH